MAESNTARLGLHVWGDEETDGPSMAEFNQSLNALEALAAIFGQGTLAARPAAGKTGRFYVVVGDGTASNNGVLWYDNGASWIALNQEDVGTMKLWGTATPPDGWSLCQGQSLSRTTYSALYAKIGTTFGSVDGSSFSLPDFRHRLLQGAGPTYALGANEGVGVVGDRVNTLGHSHNHTITSADTTHTHTMQAAGAVGVTTSSAGSHTHSGTTDGQGDHAHGFGGNTSGPDGVVTRQTASGGANSAGTAHTHRYDGSTYNAGGHAHNLIVNASGDHTHSFNLASHTHTINNATQNHDHGGTTGTSTNYFHPYLAIHVIIKIF